MNPNNFRLLPTLQFTPHLSGGRRWYAVEDPQSGRFLKLGCAEYLVASGLQNGVALPKIVEVLEANGIPSPREHAAATVAWLAKQGLLISDSSPASVSATATNSSNPNNSSVAPGPTPAARPGRLASFDPFFVRVPLLSGSLAERLSKPFAWLVRWPVALVVFALIASAGIALADGSERFWSLGEKLFIEDGRLWWLVAWLVLKSVHEFGHAVAAVSCGSRIRSAGIHFIYLAPIPYVDVTDLWSITHRGQRVLVSAAGMLAEITLASIAVLVAVFSSDLSLQYLCAAIATLGTITTLAFNANPLMKFDGYYIVSDMLGRPNLWTEAQSAANAWLAKLVNPFSGRPLVATAKSFSATLPLTIYGFATIVYRFLMLLTMAWWLILVWHGVGLLVIAWAAWAWFIRPRWIRRAQSQLIDPSASSKGRPSRRLQLAYTGLVGLALLTIGMLPSPEGVRAPGVVSYGNPTTIRAASEGFLTSLVVNDRQPVEAGQLIARLDNPELKTEIQAAKLKLETSIELANALRARGELALLQAEQAKAEALAEHIRQLQSRGEQLDIHASSAGMILLGDTDNGIGRFIKSGTAICVIVSPTELEVCGSANQCDASLFQQHQGKPIDVTGSTGQKGVGRLMHVNTRGSEHCEQESLAANYGGPLAVEMSKNDQGEAHLKFPSPRLEIKVDLVTTVDSRDWIPGQLVWLRLDHRSQRVWQWAWRSICDTLESRSGANS